MHAVESDLAAARAGDSRAFERLVEPFRRELRAHCYRMSGSVHDAEDLLQDSMIRAWRGISGFEGRSSLRTWLYRVATSACLDSLDRRGPRTLPMDLGPAADLSAPMAPPSAEPMWVEPAPDAWIDFAPASPESRYTARESVAMAFLTALQCLPPKQRAVLILRDVLGWQATECGELLDLSVASVNSALQRARETLSSRGDRLPTAGALRVDDIATRQLLARYVRAWEEADVSSLVALLHEDATLSMPPFAAWFRGAANIGASIGGMVLRPESRGHFRLVPVAANGVAGFAAYQLDLASGEFRATAIHLVSVANERVTAIEAFLDPRLFGAFGLPATSPA